MSAEGECDCESCRAERGGEYVYEYDAPFAPGTPVDVTTLDTWSWTARLPPLAYIALCTGVLSLYLLF